MTMETLKPLRIQPWGGEDPSLCHQYFYPQGKRPRLTFPERPEIITEVAVVGAGLSGLTAAYELRHKEVVILEADARPGGVCKGGEYRGCRYPEGAAYFLYPTDNDWKGWYQELGLEVDSAVITGPVSCLYYQGQWYPDCFYESGIRQLPISPKGRDDFLRLSQQLAAWERDANGFAPAGLDWEKLDQISLQHYLEVVQGYSSELAPLLDPYCRSCLGAGPAQVSAWAALYFLMSECSPEATSCAFPEGDARLAAALLKGAGPDRLRVRQVVISLQEQPEAIRLCIWDQDRQEPYLLQADLVILAIGKFAARRLLAGVSGWSPEIFQPFQYSNYVVAAVCGLEGFATPGFENWIVGEAAFSDLVLEPHPPASGEPQVMVVYAPQAFPLPRQALLQESVAVKTEEILTGLQKIWPGIDSWAEEIRMYRYGHAQVVPYPGFLSAIRGRIAPRQGRIILAHSDLDGLPCVEAAMLTGQRAARLAQQALQQ
ncbi:MAG: FAD-dependent oxidoreductase [Deltaproteobacteria bacterium]|nr:FAD-dependent oxidoreductase [Deltaproteobacteria bacterium]MBW1952520.1 FAD-dependent oxidoreductase [Deltaproteobacteria bacterium]MBW1987281.1 FAD-dependent oxidoreductase [Deltaproteobacteria bacterium]MBW2135139.1 FAD-dependent oxidoreductase [Deltaproteobacteria bacterium]